MTYTYDMFNRWIGETVTDGSGTVTINRKFVYDGNQIVLQFDSTASGDLAAANLSHRYLYGPAVDQVLADEQVSSLSRRERSLAAGRQSGHGPGFGGVQFCDRFDYNRQPSGV